MRAMKKRMAALLAALVLALGLTACGGGGNDSGGKGGEAPAAGTDLTTFYDAILAAQPEGAEKPVLFEESNPDLIENYYPGLLDIELSQQKFYMPPVVTAPCEIVLVEVKNEPDVEKVREIFQNRIDLGSDNSAYPDSAEVWKANAQVQSAGNFVCMAVLPDGNVIPDNVFAAFS